jgi:hypothetical protein
MACCEDREFMTRNIKVPNSRLRIACLLSSIAAILLPFPATTSSMLVQRKVAMPKEVKLLAATVKFHTADDDKEKDTVASLYIKLNDGTVLAQIENIKDYFKNGTIFTSKLRVLKQVPKSSIQACTGTVKTSRLKGREAWKFWYEIEFTFSDRTRTQRQCSGGVTIGENDLKVCPL